MKMNIQLRGPTTGKISLYPLDSRMFGAYGGLDDKAKGDIPLPSGDLVYSIRKNLFQYGRRVSQLFHDTL
jgi:hypothetical protein